MPSRFAPSVDMGPCQHRPYQMARFCKGGLLLLPASSATCCCCCSLLLLVAAAAGGAGVARGFTHTRCRIHERIPRQRQRFLKRARSKKSGMRLSRGKFGLFKASGKFLANRRQLWNLISTKFGFTIICFPHMTCLRISSQNYLGFVISLR